MNESPNRLTDVKELQGNDTEKLEFHERIVKYVVIRNYSTILVAPTTFFFFG